MAKKEAPMPKQGDSSPTGGRIPAKGGLQGEMLTTAEKKAIAASAKTRRLTGDTAE